MAASEECLWPDAADTYFRLDVANRFSNLSGAAWSGATDDVTSALYEDRDLFRRGVAAAGGRGGCGHADLTQRHP